MNKRNLLITAFILVCFFSYSQEFAIGIKGGLNNNTIGNLNSRGGSFQTGHPDEIFTPNNKMGYLFGAFLNIEFGKLFIRPEVNYVELKNSYDFPNLESNWSTNKIDVPVLVGYKIFDPVSIYLGPGFNFYSDVILDGANNTHGPSAIAYYKSTTTLNFGVSVEFKRFGVDLRYEMANKETPEELQDIHHSVYGTNLTDVFSYKPSQISLSLNVFLFRTNADDIGGLFSGLFRSNKCYCPY